MKKHFCRISIILSFLLVFCMLPTKNTTEAGVMNEGIIKGIFGVDNETIGTIFDNSWGMGTGTLADNFINIKNAQLNDFWKLGVKGVPVNKVAKGTIDNIKYWKGAGNFVKWGGFAIGTFDTINDSIDIVKHIYDPSKTEYQKGWSTSAKFFDNLLMIGGNAAGWLSTGFTVYGFFYPAAIATGIGATATAPIFAVGIAVTGVTRAVYKSETFGNIVDLARGRKKLVFGPFQRPDIKEGRDIIKEELGFDPYDHSNNEIPDPSTGIPVYKPNIYLYYAEDTRVNVKLLLDKYITESIPVHNPNFGWNTEIKNGSINGTEDFLFYEALVPDTGFQKETAWIVKGAKLEEDMLKILDLYAFTEKEKKDFIEFWEVKLDKNKDYVFYNEDTEIIDSVMPILVKPAPKNSYRIWFYIEEYEGQSYKEPKNIDRIIDRDHSLVEWGGIYKN